MAASAMTRYPIGAPDNLKDAVSTKIKRTVGPGFFIENLSKNRERYTVTLGYSYNELLDDSKQDEIPTICAREITSIFFADVIEENGKYSIVMPGIESIIETIKKKRNIDAIKSESVIVEKGYDRFLQIHSVALSLSPIVQILDAVEENEIITVNDLYHRKGKRKMTQYLDFLSQVEFLSKENGSYVRGPRFESQEGIKNVDEKMKTILTNLMESEHDYLQTYFHLTTMTPYVRLTNSYYYPSGSAGKMMKMLPNLLRKYQQRYYGITKPVAKVKNQAGVMRKVKIFDREDGYITGDDELFKTYCEAIGCH